jgi:hypothetical protein
MRIGSNADGGLVNLGRPCPIEAGESIVAIRMPPVEQPAREALE